MKRIVGIVYVFLCWGISLHAQSVRVIETLKKLEMENISVVEKSDTITAAFETSVYRGAYCHTSFGCYARNADSTIGYIR